MIRTAEIVGKRRLLLAISLALGTIVVGACGEDNLTSPADVAPAAHAGYVAPLLASGSTDAEDRYIVVLREGRGAALARSLGRTFADTVRHVYEHSIVGFAGDIPPQAVEGLRRNPHVAYIEQDAKAFLDGTTSDPVAGWGLGRIDQRAGPSDGYFSSSYDGTGVNIYIVDSGIDVNHPDFEGRAQPAWTWDSGYPPGEDCNGHGTAVASVAGGKEYGVARGSTLWAVRANGCNSWQWVSDWTAGLDWVTGNHVKPAVLNFSVGVSNWVDDILPGSMNDAIKRAWNAGVVVAVSAGNDDTDACGQSPANARDVLTVAASDANDFRASFSNWGSCVDLFAPGVSIWTADQGTSGYSQRNGTSFSAPFVAGVAALFLDRYPSDSPVSVRKAINEGATRGEVNDVKGTWNRLLYSRLPADVWMEGIQGPTTVKAGAVCSWTAEIRAGRSPFQVQWSGITTGSGEVLTTSLFQSGWLVADVVDSFGNPANALIWVTVEPPDGSLVC